MIVVLGFVESHIDSVFLMLFFQGIVVAWSKRININNTSMRKDLVIDKGREAFATKAEPDMAS